MAGAPGQAAVCDNSFTKWFGALVLVAVASVGCDSDPPHSAPEAKDAGAEAGDDFCPDPQNSRVHYRDKDVNVCHGITLDCTTDQNGFNNRCGCGCIDKGSLLCPPVNDPAITFISRDPAQCGDKLPYCPRGETPFNDTCGCGCTKPGG
jgi:hypothetical protein